MPAGQAIGESGVKGGAVCTTGLSRCGPWLPLLGKAVDWTWAGLCQEATLPLCTLLQVATAHPLRAEEPRPRPHPSPPTLYPHRLEASPHHRASHRAMVPHHSSVSATPVEHTHHVSCYPILLNPQ